MSDFFLDLTYKLDQLAITMIILISYIGVCVISFSSRYMKGNTQYLSFFIYLILLIFSVSVMVSSDNLWLLLASSCFSNLILVRLIVHKPKWKAAKASGIIAAKNYLLSSVCMALAFILFCINTGQNSIDLITNQSSHPLVMKIALLLLLVAAMAQSAIWPFHRWLLSSLNSPTPVSAIMHAGLVNGGGFLLVRFSSLYLQEYNIMIAIFLIGIISAILGTLWKLMQSDVKRMLACSTMGQMGFMFVQCGLGLFPFAIAHLVWHGMFKAYLFLASGSAAQDKHLGFSNDRPKALAFICSLICGALSSLIVAYTSNKSWFAGDSTLLLMVIVFLAGSQIALTMLRTTNFKNFILACAMVLIVSLMYVGSTQFITWILAPMKLMQAQPLNIFHISGISVLTLAWLCIIFMGNPSKKTSYYSSWTLKFYVKALNASQPHQDTVTAHRNHYQYQ
jgi:NAD(P)H-quinone oxidoreductase subunit 5